MKVNSLTDKLNMRAGYYQELYKSALQSETCIKQYLEDITLPMLSEEQQQKLKLDITLGKLDTAIVQTKQGKTPGSDGLPSNFIRCLRKN